MVFDISGPYPDLFRLVRFKEHLFLGVPWGTKSNVARTSPIFDGKIIDTEVFFGICLLFSMVDFPRLSG